MSSSPVRDAVLAWWADNPDASAADVAEHFQQPGSLPGGEIAPKAGTVRQWKARHGLPEAPAVTPAPQVEPWPEPITAASRAAKKEAKRRERAVTASVTPREDCNSMGQNSAAGPTFRMIPIDELHEDPANVRKHGAQNRATVKSSLREFGQVEALVVEKGTGRVIGGNCRLSVLREMGQTEVWAAEVDVHGADAARLGIVLNRSAELAEWDDEALTAMLRELGDEAKGVGWTDEELLLIMGGAEAVGDEEWGDALGELPEGDRAPIQTMTFTLHDDQAEQVKAAMTAAKGMGDFGDTGNENGNGNALARICEMFLTQWGA